METHRIWIVTTVDGKVASVASDYSGLLRTALVLSGRKENGPKSAKARAALKMAGEYGEVKTVRMGSAELLSFSASLRPEDLQLFGTDFQKEIWMKLFSLNHDGSAPKLYSYSDFARLCGRQSESVTMPAARRDSRSRERVSSSSIALSRVWLFSCRESSCQYFFSTSRAVFFS